MLTVMADSSFGLGDLSNVNMPNTPEVVYKVTLPSVVFNFITRSLLYVCIRMYIHMYV